MTLLNIKSVPAGLEGFFDNLGMEVSKAEMVAQLDKAGVESDMKLIETEPKMKNNFKITLFLLQFLKTGDENTISGRKTTSEFLRDHCLTDSLARAPGPAELLWLPGEGLAGSLMSRLYNARARRRGSCKADGKNKLFTIH